MTVPDFWDHYYMARQHEADRRFWLLKASRHSQVSVESARKNIQDALNYAISFSRRKAAWEVGEPEMRIIQIGGELSIRASREKFLARFPEAIAWLQTQGCDEQEAMRRFRDWLAEEGKHPFWRRKPPQGRRVVQRTITLTHAGELPDHDRNGGTSGAGPGDS